MPIQQLIVLDIPGLRSGDVDEKATPTLYEWANRGVIAELTPTFPCVTSPVQATMFTGRPPAEHGVIANGFYWRDRGAVEFWVATNEIVRGEHVWDALRNKRPGFTTAVWHVQNIKQAGADFIVTPAPIHEPDGTTKLWCYSKPDGLYEELLAAMGHFPLQHYWGPLANIESTKWILNAAAWLIDRHRPNLNWIYVPHLDYASQKFGPDSDQARTSLQELDRELASFCEKLEMSEIGRSAVILVVGEYAVNDVSGVIHPNRLLREAGLLAVREENGAEHLDIAGSRAFAMVDHQFAHVFVRAGDREVIGRCREVFESVPGMAGVYSAESLAEIGLNHERSGELVLIADDAHWFAYYWWLDAAAAPPFARTVDIHQKPGYDPVELFFDPASKGIPLDASLVKGSHGVPATGPQHRAVLLCSRGKDVVQAGSVYRDTDIKRMVLDLFA